MIKVSVLTTVWKRPIITAFHFRWMKWFKAECLGLGIELQPFYVLGEKDPNFSRFKRSLESYHHNYTTTDQETLSDKSQAGLQALRGNNSLDWLMHLDSDEFLSLQLMKRWRKEMKEGTKWFGSRSCFFLNLKKVKLWEFAGYPDHPVKNGGTCIHKELLEEAGWQLWTMGLNKGLNVDERLGLEELGYQAKPIDMQKVYGVLELKGGQDSIHGLEWFKERDMIEELGKKEFKELRQYHPKLRSILGDKPLERVEEGV